MIDIRNEDCLAVLSTLQDDSIDLVVTDPPYKIISGGIRKNKAGNDPSGIFNKRNQENGVGVNAKSGSLFNNNDIKFSDWIPEIFRVLKDGSHFYAMVNDKNMREVLNEADNAKFKLVNILVWKKNNCTPNRYYMKNSEFIVLFRKGKARSINNMGTKQVIEIDNIIGNKLHPTEKPVELMSILVGNSSDVGDVVLDPFMGAGSTGVASVQLGRSFVGVEIDEEYYTIAKKRIEI